MIAEFFRHPEILPISAVVLLALIFLSLKALRSRGRSLHPTALTLRTLSFLIAGALLAVAALRPHRGSETIAAQHPARDFYLAVDISLSMLATDGAPTRLASAKHKLLDLLKILESSPDEERVALVLFAGDAYLYCPPTADYDALRSFIDSISPQLITARGSDLQRALELVAHSAERAEAIEVALLVLSDGEASGDSSELKLPKFPMSISSISFGSSAGAPIALRDGHYLRDERNEIVVSKRQELTLKRLADESGGLAIEASVDTRDLELILEKLRASSTTTLQTKETTAYKEFGALLAMIALPFLMLGLRLDRRLATGLALAFIMIAPTVGWSEGLSAYDGSRAYNSGDYKKAVEIFRELVKEEPESADLQEALAAALYRNGEYAEAAKSYQTVSELLAKNQQIPSTRRAAAAFNTGNAQVKNGEISEAISSYQIARTLKPADPDIERNLQIATAMLPTPTPTPTPTAQSSPDPESTPEQQDGTPTPSTSPEPGSEQDQSENGQDGDKQNSEEKNSQESQDQQDQKKENADQSDADKEEPQEDKNAEEQQRESAPQGEPTPSAAELSKQQAREWLDSLPDAPLILRRQNSQGKEPQGGQIW